MLYQLHEWQRAFFHPLVELADVNAQLFSNPYSPLAYTPVSRRIAAGYELLYRLGKDYEQPEWLIPSVEVTGKTVAVQPRVVLEKPFCHLVHFERKLPPKIAAGPTVLVVAPLSGHHATLLRDTVRTLLTGHDVYVTQWLDARMVPVSAGEFHLDDYVHYVQEFVRLLGPKVHLISVCQPTVPVLGAVALMATQKDSKLPLSMTMMGGPIDARNSPTQVNALATQKPYSWFENNLIYRVPPKYAGAGRRVYPGFLQHAGFVAMNPDRHLKSHWDFYEDLLRGDGEDAETHRLFYDEYNAVLDLPAEYYLDTIKTVFKDYALPLGKWVVNGEKVRPEDIKEVGLFTIEGELDDISGSGQTQAAQALCSGIPKSRKQHFTAPKCGHYGIFAGRKWREVIYPRIRDFIHSQDR